MGCGIQRLGITNWKGIGGHVQALVPPPCRVRSAEHALSQKADVHPDRTNCWMISAVHPSHSWAATLFLNGILYMPKSPSMFFCFCYFLLQFIRHCPQINSEESKNQFIVPWLCFLIFKDCNTKHQVKLLYVHFPNSLLFTFLLNYSVLITFHTVHLVTNVYFYLCHLVFFQIYFHSHISI